MDTLIPEHVLEDVVSEQCYLEVHELNSSREWNMNSQALVNIQIQYRKTQNKISAQG